MEKFHNLMSFTKLIVLLCVTIIINSCTPIYTKKEFNKIRGQLSTGAWEWGQLNVGAFVSGRMISKDTGYPVKNVKVLILGAVRAVTDLNGLFCIKDVPLELIDFIKISTTTDNYKKLQVEEKSTKIKITFYCPGLSSTSKPKYKERTKEITIFYTIERINGIFTVRVKPIDIGTIQLTKPK